MINTLVASDSMILIGTEAIKKQCDATTPDIFDFFIYRGGSFEQISKFVSDEFPIDWARIVVAPLVLS